MLFTSQGRSVLGKTVPSVLCTALGLRPRADPRPRVQFFPIRTSCQVNNIYVCTCSMLGFWFTILQLVLQGKSKVYGAKVETCMYNHVVLDLELNELNITFKMNSRYTKL